jgi:bifunctional DNA-binding transcriptional regulator/antitoxin component of YhaV-PrlF toxin-antitoxin module
LEKRIRVSTQGRITIPKLFRDTLKVPDGQPILIRTVPDKKEIVLEILATMSDYK